MPFSPKDDESIVNSLKNSDVVINLIGKYYETKHIVPTRRANGKLSRVNYTYDDVHVHIPAKIAKLAKQAGVKNFIHVSALAGNPNSGSAWVRSKFAGEAAVRSEFPEAVKFINIFCAYHNLPPGVLFSLVMSFFIMLFEILKVNKTYYYHYIIMYYILIY